VGYLGKNINILSFETIISNFIEKKLFWVDPVYMKILGTIQYKLILWTKLLWFIVFKCTINLIKYFFWCDYVSHTCDYGKRRGMH